MEVPDVKIRNTAKDLTIGIGGHLIKDVTGNSHKGLVKKVKLEEIQFFKNFKYFHLHFTCLRVL